jgi:exonuclease III
MNGQIITMKMFKFAFYIICVLLLTPFNDMCSSTEQLNINTLTWNVRGAMSSSASLSKLLDIFDVDIAFISEHKLKPHCKDFFNSIHTDYLSVSRFDNSTMKSTKLGKGGVSILYRKQLSFNIKEIEHNFSDRIVGIEICHSNEISSFLFSVYLPSVNYDFDEFKDCIDILETISEKYSKDGNVMFFGDFNVDVFIDKPDKRDKYFKQFLNRNNMSYAKTAGCNHTFRPTLKTLDYVVFNQFNDNMIAKCEVIDNDLCHVSDHNPIHAILNIKFSKYSFQESSYPNTNWSKCSENEKREFENITNIDVNDYLENAVRSDPINLIDNMYLYLVNLLLCAADKTLPKFKFNKHSKPYWTTEVKFAHSEQRRLRRIWISEGKPRGKCSVSFTNYKNAKRKFKQDQVKAISDVDRQFYENLEEHAECDSKLFWRTVNRRRKKKQNIVRGIISDDNSVQDNPIDIAESFKKTLSTHISSHRK